jgi:hypothetical protein
MLKLSILIPTISLIWSYSLMAQNDRITVLFETGSGPGFISNNVRNWGYHTIGFGAAYRMKPLFSVDAALRYHNFEGQRYGFGDGETNVNASENLHGLSIAIGPEINLRCRNGHEFSLTLRAGAMVQRTNQYLWQDGQERASLYYKPLIIPVAELSGRWNLWLNNSTALNMDLNLLTQSGKVQVQETTHTTGNPLPERNNYRYEQYKTYLEEMARHDNYSLFSFSAGIRKRLGADAPDKTLSNIPTTPSRSSWGMLAGTQMMVADPENGHIASGVHFGLYYSHLIRSGVSAQVEMQLKFGPSSILPVLFQDYLVTPRTYTYFYKEIRPTGIRMFELPLLLNFHSRSHPRNAWIAGIRPSLIAVGSVEQGGSVQIGTLATEPFNDIKIRSGVREMDCGLTIGYQRALWRKVYLDLRYTQGLTDLTHDNFFKRKDTYTNSDLQASVRLAF